MSTIGATMRARHAYAIAALLGSPLDVTLRAFGTSYDVTAITVR